MNTLFYAHLAANNPIARDHLRLGVEPAYGESDGNTSTEFNASSGVATSFCVLDAFLPWRGWPVGAMTEIMTDTVGCGELSLLLPAMARLTQQKRPILCIGAPHTLFAPALSQVRIDPAYVTQINPSSTLKHNKENLWSVEQALKTGLPGMVVLWSPTHGHCLPETPEVLRRLQLATIGRETMLIHFRSKSCMSQPSPAWLRFGYAADDTHIRLQVLKCRGRLLTRPLITLDRESVQARLYGHFQATDALSTAAIVGLKPLPTASITARAPALLNPAQPHHHASVETAFKKQQPSVSTVTH